MPDGSTPAEETNKTRILIYDHIQNLREAVATVLERKGCEVYPCATVADAVETLEKQQIDVIIANSTTPNHTGTDIIPLAKERWSYIEIVLISSAISLDAALEAIQKHVYEVLELPLDTTRLERTVRNAADHARMAKERVRLLNELNQQNELLERQVRTVTRELREKSIRDELTGLFNYRYFLKTLETELSRVQRYERTMSLAMLDLDHFKKLNDALGHQKGNEVLSRVSLVMEEGCRNSDLPIRYGGEEFALILPETSKLAAKHLVDRIRIEVEQLGIKYETEDGLPMIVTISAGIAAAPEDGITSEQLIRKADAALYRAKANGRNQIQMAGE